MKSLAILHGLARCGGTVISRCIGCMDRIAMLHEIHPNGPTLANKLLPDSGSQFNALYQAVSWYPFLFDAKDRQWAMRKIYENNDLDTIQKIAHRVSNHDMSLVIRDWPHLDFIGKPFLEETTCKLSLTEILSGHFLIHDAYILRNPVKQYLSMVNSGSSHSYLTHESGIRHFLKGYRAFAEIAAKNHFVKYEDFTTSPEITIKLLTEQLHIPFDPEFINKWKNYANVTGDTKRMDSSDIIPAEHRELDTVHQQIFADSDDYNTAIQLLGYSSDF